jgi:DNA polymerase-3 subunit alpha
MAFMSIEDKTGEIEVVIFPRVYKKDSKLWERDRVLIIAGSISHRDNSNSPNGGLKIIAEEVEELTAEHLKANNLPKSISNYKRIAIQGVAKNLPPASTPAVKPERVYIRLQNSDDQKILLSIKTILDSYGGDTEVVLVIGSAEETPQVIKLPSRINKQPKALSGLIALVGKDNVKVK